MRLNSRSCMLDSFARVLTMNPSDLAGMVGHQGPEGFHSQELIEIACQKGYAVTMIERHPVAQNPETGVLRKIKFFEGNPDRMGRHMKNADGVLMGRTSVGFLSHAVAWNHQFLVAYDSAIGQQYNILDEHGRPDDMFFIPSAFLRIEKR